VYGARPLKRLIQRRLENKIATALLKGEFAEGDAIEVRPGKEGIEVGKRRRRREIVNPVTCPDPLRMPRVGANNDRAA
jgi:hypothetical protein